MMKKSVNTKNTNKEENIMKDATAKKTNKKSKKVETPAAKTEEVKVEETKVETPKVDEKVETPKKKRNIQKTVRQMTNEELKELFETCGCKAYSNAKSASVVYNQFGTNSRILQQGRAYQLLLTNGHKRVKNEVIDVEYNDVERFKAWYSELDETLKVGVSGFDTIDAGTLSDSEFPREKTVKLTSFDLLENYLKYMGTFDENKLSKATAEAVA